jgi:hypothetical protein
LSWQTFIGFEIDKGRPCVVIDAEREEKLRKIEENMQMEKSLKVTKGKSEVPLGEIDSWNFDDCADC